jgi:hypothetical protein
MGKVDDYRIILQNLDDWDAYLLQESRLPGPRGNLELAQAAAIEGDEAHFEHWLSFGPKEAPVNSPYEFLAFCGVLGQGKLLIEGDPLAMERLRSFASDPRWRTREAVAMALQNLGRVDMDRLLVEMHDWSQGGLLEKRAAAAGLCEPDLLERERYAGQVLQILDRITASIEGIVDRKQEDFKVLRKGLAYCWSVAVVAYPSAGKRLMEKYFSSDDLDIRWIMKENLKKKRMERMDAAWVAASRLKMATYKG